MSGAPRWTILTGWLRVLHNDGTEGEVAPGDAYVIEQGHDEWVVGDDPVGAFEFESAETFARGYRPQAGLFSGEET